MTKRTTERDQHYVETFGRLMDTGQFIEVGTTRPTGRELFYFAISPKGLDLGVRWMLRHQRVGERLIRSWGSRVDASDVRALLANDEIHSYAVRMLAPTWRGGSLDEACVAVLDEYLGAIWDGSSDHSSHDFDSWGFELVEASFQRTGRHDAFLEFCRLHLLEVPQSTEDLKPWYRYLDLATEQLGVSAVLPALAELLLPHLASVRKLAPRKALLAFLLMLRARLSEQQFAAFWEATVTRVTDKGLRVWYKRELASGQ